jgi:hypothetical protein
MQDLTEPRGSTTRLNRVRVALVVGVAMFAVACTTGGATGTTTTTTTTTTSSTTSTTINPACASYTPSGVVVDNPAPFPGDALTVSGNGTDDTTIELKLVPVGPGSPTGVLATATVAGGTWSTGLTVPNGTAPGDYNVVANALGCSGTATALISVQ